MSITEDSEVVGVFRDQTSVNQAVDALKRFARAVVKKKFDELEGDMA